MNDNNSPPFDAAVLESLAHKVEDNRADLISRYQNALRETVFTNRSVMHPRDLAHIAPGEVETLISQCRN